MQYQPYNQIELHPSDLLYSTIHPHTSGYHVEQTILDVYLDLIEVFL